MMADATGAMSRLLPKLGGLLIEEPNLHRRVRREIRFVLDELESIHAFLSLSARQLDEQDKLWAREMGALSYQIDSAVEEFLVGTRARLLRTADPPGGLKGFIAKISYVLTIAKACNQLSTKIRNVMHLLAETTKRRGRYHIDSTLLRRHPRLPDLHVELGNGVETELATGAMLAECEGICKIPSGVKDVIHFLQRELESMQVALRRIAEVPADEVDEGTKAWVDDMMDVSCDLKHTVDNLRERIGARRSQRLKGFIAKVNFILMTAKARRRFAAEIRDSKYCFLEVSKRRQRYFCQIQAPRRASDDDLSATNDSRLLDLRPDSESLVGIDGPRDVLVRRLTEEGSTSEQQLKLASIVGLAGVGKTALAKAVYHSLAPRFDCTAWVSLSNKPVVQRALADLLRQISQEDQPQGDFEAMSEGQLINEIRNTLHDKRYFVVVDCIWDLSAWEILKNALIENSNGSAVLTTSRKVDIARHIGGVYTLSRLSEIDSRKLFFKRLFHSDDKCTPELAEISKKIIEKCGGIPLAIIGKAGLLASKPRTVENWLAVQREQDLNDMRSMVAPSYDDLPFHLKSCLLYLSMFQKGHEISGERLVCGWIAEGFILETHERTLQEEGESCLNELVNRNLIEPVEVDGGGKVLSCRVYDLVHDFIISLSTEEKFVTILDAQQGRSFPDTVHRLSIQGNNVENSLPQVLWSDVRSLVVSGDAKLMPPLSEFRGLRVLDLGGCDSLQTDYLKGIANSVLLKYLVIGGKCITGVPKEIGNLSLLQTLDLRASGLKELPGSVLMIKQLERLYVNSLMKIPDGIGKMKALQELGDINISKPELLKELCKLTKLRILRIAIWSWDESCNDPLPEYLRSLIMGRQNMQSLTILTCCSLHFMDNWGAQADPPSLEKLEIRYSTFRILPGWIRSLQNLSSLSIEVNKLSQEVINMLGKLLTLRSLSLTSKHAPEGRFGIGTDEFRNLTSFHFVSNAMGEVFAPGAMQVLKRLKLSFQALRTKDECKDFSFGLENLSSLETVHVEIICFNASLWMVENAEAAIGEAISRGHNRRPNLEIRRVREEDMVENEEEVATSNIKQEQKKATKKRSSSRNIRVARKSSLKRKKALIENMRCLLVNSEAKF